MATQVEIPEFHEDEFMVSLGGSDVAMTFGVAAPELAPEPSSPLGNLLRVRMSLEHAKMMVMILRKNLKRYERSTGISIEVPPKVYTGLGVSSEDW